MKVLKMLVGFKQINILIFLLFITTSQLFSQNTTDSIKYSIDFKFNDGVFLKFEDVISNQAVPFKNIISNENYSDESFITKVLSKEKIRIFIEGDKKEFSTHNIWGYAKNGVLYTRFSDQFYRVPSIGKISFFVANVEVEYQSQVDPWSSNYYNMYDRSYTTTELRKFLLDFSDGTLYEYSIQNIAKLIEPDKELFNDFMALKRKKRKQMAFIYIRRFNENNPLFFPKH